MKQHYTHPVMLLTEVGEADIIRTSGLTKGNSLDAYDDSGNLSDLFHE